MLTMHKPMRGITILLLINTLFNIGLSQNLQTVNIRKLILIINCIKSNYNYVLLTKL